MAFRNTASKYVVLLCSTVLFIPEASSSKDVLQGAHYLLELQGASSSDPRWEFDVGSGSVSDNYGGIVAQALLEAFRATKEDYLRQAALAYAEHLEASSLNKKGAFKIYLSDVEFMVSLSRVTGQEQYEKWAKRWSKTEVSVKKTVAKLVTARRLSPGLIGFDGAIAIRAALALGDRPRAQSLASEILKHHTTWNVPTLKQIYYAVVSKGALLEALSFLGGHEKDCERLAKSLVKEQDKNGAWLTNETQATAYALRGLAAHTSKAGEKSLRKALGWLRNSQLSTGAWPVYNDQVAEVLAGSNNSEVHSEALIALIRAERALGGG